MKRILSRSTLQLILIVWSIIAVSPFVLVTILAFRPDADIFQYPMGIGGTFTFANFIAAWNGPIGGSGISAYLLNSLILAIIALAVSITVGAPAAYFAAFLRPAFKRTFQVLLLVATVVPLVLLVVPYYQLFDALYLTNNLLAVGVGYGVIALPTTILVLIAFFEDFPGELVEAAELDGLGTVAAFRRVVLPLSSGAVVGVAMLTLIFVWGEAQLGIVLLQQADKQSVPVGLLGFRGEFTVQLGPIFAGLAIATVPIIIVYLVLNRSISKGIALGGAFR